MQNPRYLGVIEGFYGRPWPWSERLELPEFMGEYHLNTYIYAPKSDSRLRKNWRQPWTDKELLQLRQMSDSCKASKILFGVGLSPLGFDPGSVKDREQMAIKLGQIAEISRELLCILFDDIHSTGAGMAQEQIKACAWIRATCNPRRLIVCPTYYSTDPALEKLFGARPRGYWHEMGSGIDPDADFFWTGERVCSKNFSRDNLELVANELNRVPILWDNYPVNDGEISSRFLFLEPFRGREPFLRELAAGHFSNPMNQPQLSRIALSTLHLVYRGNEKVNQGELFERVWREYLTVKLGPLGNQLQKDARRFSKEGLDSFSESEKQKYIGKYSGYDSPCAREVVEWLNGGYRFDPACLTG